MGLDRTLVGAYKLLNLKGDKWNGKCPRHYKAWSAKYQWVARARAYDQFIDAERIQMRLDRMGELEHRRFLFELQEQELTQAAVAKMRARLALVEPLQVYESNTREVSGEGAGKTIVSTKTKPPTLAQYAALQKQVDATAAQAILGVRPQSLKAITAPEKPQFDEKRLKQLEQLTPDELAEYRAWLTRLTHDSGSDGDRAETLAKQD